MNAIKGFTLQCGCVLEYQPELMGVRASGYAIKTPCISHAGAAELSSRALTKADIAMQAAAELAAEGRAPLLLNEVPPPPIHTLCEPNGMLAKKQAPNDIQPHVFQEGKDGYCTVCNTLENYIPGRHVTQAMLDEFRQMPPLTMLDIRSFCKPAPKIEPSIESWTEWAEGEREAGRPVPPMPALLRKQAPGGELPNDDGVWKTAYGREVQGKIAALEPREFYADTVDGRSFVCQTGVDNNIAEVFDWNTHSAALNAERIAHALNGNGTKKPDGKDPVGERDQQWLVWINAQLEKVGFTQRVKKTNTPFDELGRVFAGIKFEQVCAAERSFEAGKDAFIARLTAKLKEIK